MSCKYCKGESIKFTTRNDFDDDTSCPLDEYDQADCEKCNGCHETEYEFTIYPPDKFHNYAFFTVNFKCEFPNKDNPSERIVLHQDSDRIDIKFCPFCGEKF